MEKQSERDGGDILSCLFVVFQIPDFYAAYLSLSHTQTVHIITHCGTPLQPLMSADGTFCDTSCEAEAFDDTSKSVKAF